MVNGEDGVARDSGGAVSSTPDDGLFGAGLRFPAGSSRCPSEGTSLVYAYPPMAINLASAAGVV